MNYTCDCKVYFSEHLYLFQMSEGIKHSLLLEVMFCLPTLPNLHYCLYCPSLNFLLTSVCKFTEVTVPFYYLNLIDIMYLHVLIFI